MVLVPSWLTGQNGNWLKKFRMVMLSLLHVKHCHKACSLLLPKEKCLIRPLLLSIVSEIFKQAAISKIAVTAFAIFAF